MGSAIQALEGGLNRSVPQILIGTTLVGLDLVSGGKGRAAKSTVDEVAAALQDLAVFRSELGMHGGTLARLDINGTSIYGMSGHGQDIKYVLNGNSIDHAEADVFQQAINKGVNGKSATLYIDNPNGPCGACGQNGGIGSMLRGSGIDEVDVFWPTGSDFFSSARKTKKQ